MSMVMVALNHHNALHGPAIAGFEPRLLDVQASNGCCLDTVHAGAEDSGMTQRCVEVGIAYLGK